MIDPGTKLKVTLLRATFHEKAGYFFGGPGDRLPASHDQEPRRLQPNRFERIGSLQKNQIRSASSRYPVSVQLQVSPALTVTAS